MACQVGASMPSSALFVMETLTVCAMQKWSIEPNFSGQISKIGIKDAPFLGKRYTLKFFGGCTFCQRAFALRGSMTWYCSIHNRVHFLLSTEIMSLLATVDLNWCPVS